MTEGAPTSPHDVPVSGVCDERFAAVEGAFRTNFVERGEVGAGVAVFVDGALVVDLVGGWTDAARTRTWQADTLVDVYSVGKAFVALLLLQLVDEGRIGLDDPLSSIWPEFAVGGKEAATVRHALCHRAGVPGIRQPLTDTDLWEWSAMTAALADCLPWWPPGTRHAYHTNTYGHLIGEPVHRLTGHPPGAALRVVAESLRADVWCGLPAEEHPRCADVLWALGPIPLMPEDAARSEEERMIELSYFNPPGYSSVGVVNSPEWRSAQVPSTNTHATAQGVARIYQALLEPGRLLRPDLLADATSPQSTGYCPILGEDATFGLGFTPTTPRRPFGPGGSSFGHFGTGGAVGFADPDRQVAFGYVMNHVIPRWQSSRNRAVIDTLYACL